jgi:curved DNA-binding protein CbpA
MALTDPYKVLGIPHSATDAEIRTAYRRQVQLHHPDHNGGSPESARRFEQVQEAYAMILKLERGRESGGPSASSRARTSSRPSQAPASDPGLEQRLADLERDLAAQREAKREAVRRAQQIREDALRQAREAAQTSGDRSSDEDLGYVTTDDSFSAILDDAADAWSKRIMGDGDGDGERGDDGERKREPVNERLADLFDDLGARLRGDKPHGAGGRRDDD